MRNRTVKSEWLLGDKSRLQSGGYALLGSELAMMSMGATTYREHAVVGRT